MSTDSYSDDLAALGAALAQAREDRGLDRTVLARHLTLSAMQLKEIEQGGQTGFYSESHKRLAARKVAAYLQVTWPPAGDAT